jgi:hypothetical protein
MTTLQNIQTVIARDESTPIRSHQSYDSQVHAVCHHSGQYLTQNEARHSIWDRFVTNLLKEQHDFPGLPTLDRAFGRAYHADNHQHVIWSRITIRSIGCLLLTPLILLLVLALFELRDFVPLVVWYVYLAGLVLLTAVAAGLILYALFQISRRSALFHKYAVNRPPAVLDYPVIGKMQITTREEITIDLDNMDQARPQVLNQQGRLSIKLFPDNGNWENYVTYRQQYEAFPVGQYFHGGVVALDNLKYVQFSGDHMEFDHRIILRTPADPSDIDDDTGLLPPVTVDTDYHILPAAFYPNYRGVSRFPLECEPRLAPNDSRTLELHFSWRGQNPNDNCRLEECVLHIPGDSLGKVTKVTYGRYHPDLYQPKIIWRNRAFNQRHLVLRISFEEPILQCHEMLTGNYQFSADGLLSGMEINPKHIWNALGHRVKSEHCDITRRTIVSGKLSFGLQRLSQEHELVHTMPPIVCNVPPDDRSAQAVIDVLLEEGFDLQRVMRSAPRLDPTGRLDKQLFYWDILGRKYDAELLDSLDIHVVISGSDRIINTSKQNAEDTFRPVTNIDLRVRCLHDPRNEEIVKEVDALLGQQAEKYSLAVKIKNYLEQYHERPCS